MVMSAFFSTRYLTTFIWPFWAAWCRGAFWMVEINIRKMFRYIAFSTAGWSCNIPSCIRILCVVRQSDWELIQSVVCICMYMYVYVLSLTPISSLMLMLAFFATRYVTMSTWPFSAARCRRVLWWGGINQLEENHYIVMLCECPLE